MSYRLGVFVTHPIQYYAPWFRHLARRMDVEVFYAHHQDGMGQSKSGFGIEFEWDIPLLDGYHYRWLKNVARKPTVRNFNGCDTPEIYNIVRTGRFDAFLLNGWNRRSAWQTMFACWRHQVPVMIRGDSQLQTERSGGKQLAKYLPYRFWLPRIDAHLYVGQRNKEYLQHYGVPRERLFFAPHFVDNAFFREHSQKALRCGTNLKLRAEFGIPPDAFVVLYAGKFIPVKRPADFLRGCIKAIEQFPDENIHCLLVGLGPLQDELEQLARARPDHIHFAGFRNQREMPSFYSAANLLVLPGRETWGMVANEAMACGVPCVVSDAAGCEADLIQPGVTGLAYPLGDINALAACILEMKRRQQTDSDGIQAALREKANCYSVENATLGLEQALDKII